MTRDRSMEGEGGGFDISGALGVQKSIIKHHWQIDWRTITIFARTHKRRK